MRPSREELLVATAFTWAQRSTCSRLSVGAVAHRDGRILVQGYNGAPAGLPHCNHDCNCTDKPWTTGELGHNEDCASLQPCTRATHAEANAIAWAAREGVALDGAQWTITHEPCVNCSRMLINSGAAYILYVYPYRLHEGVELLREAGVPVEQYLDWEEPRVIGLDE